MCGEPGAQCLQNSSRAFCASVFHHSVVVGCSSTSRIPSFQHIFERSAKFVLVRFASATSPRLSSPNTFSADCFMTLRDIQIHDEHCGARCWCPVSFVRHASTHASAKPELVLISCSGLGQYFLSIGIMRLPKHDAARTILAFPAQNSTPSMSLMTINGSPCWM